MTARDMVEMSSRRYKWTTYQFNGIDCMQWNEMNVAVFRVRVIDVVEEIHCMFSFSNFHRAKQFSAHRTLQEMSMPSNLKLCKLFDKPNYTLWIQCLNTDL